MHSASFTAQTEVDGAGAQTTAFPAASAGAISSAGIVYGQFHGRDDADDAARDAVGEDPLRCVDRGRQRAVQPRRVGGRHAPVLDELLHLAVRLGVERLALIERQRAREIVAALLDQVGDAVHGGRPLEGGARSPVAPRGVRGRDRRRASSRVPSGTVPRHSPVAGLVASKRAPDSDSTHSPPITIE